MLALAVCELSRAGEPPTGTLPPDTTKLKNEISVSMVPLVFPLVGVVDNRYRQELYNNANSIERSDNSRKLSFYYKRVLKNGSLRVGIDYLSPIQVEFFNSVVNVTDSTALFETSTYEKGPKLGGGVGYEYTFRPGRTNKLGIVTGGDLLYHHFFESYTLQRKLFPSDSAYTPPSSLTANPLSTELLFQNQRINDRISICPFIGVSYPFSRHIMMTVLTSFVVYRDFYSQVQIDDKGTNEAKNAYWWFESSAGPISDISIVYSF